MDEQKKNTNKTVICAQCFQKNMKIICMFCRAHFPDIHYRTKTKISSFLMPSTERNQSLAVCYASSCLSYYNEFSCCLSNSTNRHRKNQPTKNLMLSCHKEQLKNTSLESPGLLLFESVTVL